MKDTILKKAINHLEEATGLHADWRAKPQNSIDGYLVLKKDGRKHSFPAEVKKEFRSRHLLGLLDLKEKYGQLAVIANVLSGKLKKNLQENDIAYIDGAGNACITAPGLYILVEGKKQPPDLKKTRHRAFTKTGIKIVFHFLLKENLINEPYRTIAEATGTSLDTISKTISSLNTLGFIVNLDDKNQKLVRKKELLNRWIYQYGDKLKPSLFMGSFRFLAPEKDWKKFALDAATQWGGEPAGDLLTGYLKPEIFLLYTEQTRSELMKQLRLVPDDDGKIEVYRHFWTVKETEQQTVPSLLVYADLIYSGDPRNLETAQRIYERYLQDEFE